MSDAILRNAVGCLLRIVVRDDDTNLPIDISSATEKTIVLIYPSKKIVDLTAEFYTDGTDGEIYYSTVSGDLDERGQYRIKARVVTPGQSYGTKAGVFSVV